MKTVNKYVPLTKLLISGVLILTAASARPAQAQSFAPYIDMSITADENAVSMASASGVKAYTLAFLDADGACNLGWGGLAGPLPADSLANGTSMLTVVQQLKAAGVTPIFSIGGADGVDPAAYCSSASALQAVYQNAVTRYGITYLDFDIEGAATAEPAQITMRDQALVGLKNANPGLVISYTLPVLTTGLVAGDGLNVITSAKSDGVALSVVNAMTMDFGTSGLEMGNASTQAAAAVESQIKSAGLSSTVGITPMIGQNDSSGEIFSLADATTVTNFAKANSYVSRLAMWSMGRDNGSCAGSTVASPSCSGVSQATYAFSAIFKGFGGSGGGGTAPTAPTGLSASAGNAQVALSWGAASGATSYNVYRGTTSGGESGTAIATGITSTVFTNTGLTNGTKYYYNVAAVNSIGTSAHSTEASATPSAGSGTEGPYLGTPWAIPGTVQAENYDTGGQGVGYSIGTNSGTGNSYRTDGVDLETTTDTNGGYDVGWTAAGQWFRYTVNVATAGTYTVTLRVAANAAVTNGLHISNSTGTNLSGEVSLPSTGGWQNWETVSTSVTLPAGKQVLTVNQDTGGWNFNYVTFASSGGGGGNYNGTWQLTPENSTGLRLDVAGNGTANGTVLNAYTSNGTGAQSFTFSNTSVVPAGDYNFVKTGGSYCIQPTGTASGSTVEIWACAGTAAQAWSVVADTSPAGYFHLSPSSAGATCLNNTGTASGSSVTISTCNSSTGQQWSGL